MSPVFPPSVVLAQGSTLASYAKVYELQADGVNGGAAASGWQTRVLNTEIDPDGILTLASNRIVLAAGTYDSLILVPQVNVGGATARLRNVTGGTTVLIGMDVYALPAGGAANLTPVVGRFTIAASQSLEVQSYCTFASATFGLGIANNFGVGEVYTVAEFWKVS